MKKIEVGDYVRIVEARRSMISKVYDVQEGKTELIDKKYFCMVEGVEEWFTSKDIVKNSWNILDVLEKGDYVNGYKAVHITGYYVEVESNHRYDLCFEEDEIEDILTHEMYEKKCYKVKEEK